MSATNSERQAHTEQYYVEELKDLLRECLNYIPAGNGARLAEDYEEHPLRTSIKEALLKHLSPKEQLYIGLQLVEKAVMKDESLAIDEKSEIIRTYRSDIEFISANKKVAVRVIYLLSRQAFNFTATDPKD